MATSNAVRVFQDAPAVRTHSPLIIGLTGSSWSGKTFSGLRLATGICKALGGEIYGIDTEADRMLHYSDYFKFRHVAFRPPHGPLDYLAAINHCASKPDCKVILIDSMSHEHDGEGGVLDQIEEFLDRKAGDDFEKRAAYQMVAQVKPKRERKKLNRRIVQLGNIVFILCYRAEEKIKPRKKGERAADGSREPENLGWQPTTTSKLTYDMTVRFLLTPGCEGVPALMPVNPAEKLLVKQPVQFKDWFRQGEPLSESMGERLALWSLGKTTAPAAAASPSVDQQQASSAHTVSEKPPTVAEYEACQDWDTFNRLEQRRGSIWKTASPQLKTQLKDASEKTNKRLDAGKYADAQVAIDALRTAQDTTALTAIWREIADEYRNNVPLPIEVEFQQRREHLEQL